MLTREERRKLEAEWSADDRSIASFARLLKGAVLSIVVLGLLWIAGTGERPESGREATAAGAAAVAQGDGAAMRASQQVYEERRAQWKGTPAQSLKQASK